MDEVPKDDIRSWINEPPYCDCSDLEKERLLAAFNDILAIRPAIAEVFVDEMKTLLSYARAGKQTGE